MFPVREKAVPVQRGQIGGDQIGCLSGHRAHLARHGLLQFACVLSDRISEAENIIKKSEHN